MERIAVNLNHELQNINNIKLRYFDTISINVRNNKESP